MDSDSSGVSVFEWNEKGGSHKVPKSSSMRIRVFLPRTMREENADVGESEAGAGRVHI